MMVLNVSSFQVVGRSDVVMGSQNQAGSFALEELPRRIDFIRARLLACTHAVESPEHKCVGVSEHSFIKRQLIPSLINPLIHRNGVTCALGHDVLEGQPGAEEELEGTGDTLLKGQRARILRLLKDRPSDAADLGHAREAVIELSQVLIGLCRVTPAYVDAESAPPCPLFPRPVNPF